MLRADENSYVKLYYDNAEKLSTVTGGVDVTGDVSVSEGDILFSTAGKGIVLGATTNVSANTLDDYEEGSWTPSIGGDASYNVQSGVYTKVGNLVTCWYNQAISSIGTGSTTETSGLPFAVKHIIEQNVNGTQVAYFTNLLLDVVSLSACPERNTSAIRYATMAAAGDATTVAAAIFKSSTDIYAMVTYQTN